MEENNNTNGINGIRGNFYLGSGKLVRGRSASHGDIDNIIRNYGSNPLLVRGSYSEHELWEPWALCQCSENGNALIGCDVKEEEEKIEKSFLSANSLDRQKGKGMNANCLFGPHQQDSDVISDGEESYRVVPEKEEIGAQIEVPCPRPDANSHHDTPNAEVPFPRPDANIHHDTPSTDVPFPRSDASSHHHIPSTVQSVSSLAVDRVDDAKWSPSLAAARKFVQSQCSRVSKLPTRSLLRKGSECAEVDEIQQRIKLMCSLDPSLPSYEQLRRDYNDELLDDDNVNDFNVNRNPLGVMLEETLDNAQPDSDRPDTPDSLINCESDLQLEVIHSPTKSAKDKTVKDGGPGIQLTFRRISRTSMESFPEAPKEDGNPLLRSQSQSTIPSGSEFDEDESEDLEEVNKIRVGICAMNKKTYSRPMKEILSRLRKVFLLDFEVFPDEVILHEPIENWPVVDCLISFYSKGFPLDKAIKYTELRKPFVLNDLEFQYHLMDRRRVYELLVDAGIEVPRYAVFNRDDNNQPVEGEDIIEYDDVIEVNGQTFTKPFVEKPVNAEDHNIYIYYPSAAGGGCQILFRKIGSRSSVYSSESRVRRTGSYIYEDFMATDGTDVKIYTVGEEYAHAEARKSPALDGKVERDAQGKEVRYPIILSAHEKLIAKKVCSTFKQTVCGFDLLRANGKALVCDVNGFSFVKTSRKYYDDCSQILADIIFQKIAPQLWIPSPLDFTVPRDISDETPVHTTASTMLELRCVIAIIRHGDRTPKQKMKMIVQHDQFFDLFEKYGGFEEGRLKLKKPKQLQEILDITRSLLAAIRTGEHGPIKESPAKLLQLKSVLEMYGHFSGINRKVQIKSLADKRNQDIWSKFKGRNKNSEATFGDPNKPSLLLIVKWGGELTPLGKKQAEELGKAFRCMYPGEYGRFPGCGFLRLHSTYRHDLKIYASDEGRVQMTAAAFAKGLLALEGELTPILVHLVKSDKYVTGMLDTSSDVTISMQRVKSRLHEIMYSDEDFTEEDKEKLVPTGAVSLVKAMDAIKNPHKKCQEVFDLVRSLTEQIRQLGEQEKVDPNAPILYHEESLRLMEHRWSKLEKDFKQLSDGFDISLIPDIYDCVKYDNLHNRSLRLKNLQELYTLSKSLADIVIPQEYGITKEEKLSISKQICTRLLKKIKADLKHTVDESETVHRLDPRYSRDVETPHRHVRTRLYFTSESHVHSMLSVLRYGGLLDEMTDDQWKRALEKVSEVSELSYLTQIVIMQYEDPMQDPLSDQRYHVEIYFSPGLKSPDEIMNTDGSERKKNPARRRHISREERFGSSDCNRRGRTLSGSESYFQPTDDLPAAVLQYNSATSRNARQSPPKTAVLRTTSSGTMKTRYALRSVPQTYRTASGQAVSVGRSVSHPVMQPTPSPTSDAVRDRLSADSMLSSAGEGIETLPSLHPLMTIHSAVNMKQMDQFLDDTISEFNDSDDVEFSSPPAQGGKAKKEKKRKRSLLVSQLSMC